MKKIVNVAVCLALCTLIAFGPKAPITTSPGPDDRPINYALPDPGPDDRPINYVDQASNSSVSVCMVADPGPDDRPINYCG